MKKIKVFGHKAPDTDAVVSAITYAWYLSEITKQPAQAYILGAPNKETEYVLNRFDADTPPLLDNVNTDDTIVLVDTNNPDELLETVHDAQLLEIIDHHKLFGGITTPGPVSIFMRPMASTSSLIYTLINPELHAISSQKAGLMLAGILSDTLEFRSPTTTDEDKEIAEELAKIAGVQIHELATEMFAAKSDISHLNAEGLIMMDSKVFTIHGKHLRISVVETTNPRSALSMKQDLQNYMKTHSAENQLDDVLMFVVDILNEEATVITATEQSRAIIEKAFDVSFDGEDTVLLPGVVSRKKQIIPKLEE